MTPNSVWMTQPPRSTSASSRIDDVHRAPDELHQPWPLLAQQLAVVWVHPEDHRLRVPHRLDARWRRSPPPPRARARDLADDLRRDLEGQVERVVLGVGENLPSLHLRPGQLLRRPRPATSALASSRALAKTSSRKRRASALISSARFSASTTICLAVLWASNSSALSTPARRGGGWTIGLSGTGASTSPLITLPMTRLDDAALPGVPGRPSRGSSLMCDCHSSANLWLVHAP